jgi:RNA-directed DNA polymerase
MMELLRRHTDCKWLLLYAERWLKALVQKADGSLEERTKGTPQGGVISPLLANLYLHHAFDEWMRERAPTIPFERYADDVVIHCKDSYQVRIVRAEVEKRLAEFKLELNPEKTKEVYCKDDTREGGHPITKFNFLGFEFRPSSSRRRKDGQLFVSFSPAISPKALKKIYRTIREWELHRRTRSTLEDIAKEINPVLRGWMNYYGSYYKSALGVVYRRLNWILNKWATRKYKRLKGSKHRAWAWLNRIMEKEPTLFAHWGNTNAYE